MRLRSVTAVAATLVSVAGLAGGALAATLVPPAVPHPVAVGPVSGETGFPVSYTDSSGVRLEGCLDGGDPMCALTPVDGFDPTAATSFPDNFPDEFFYQLASASITTGNGGKATLTEALEGAFANGPVKDGDQMVFGRFRLRITNAVPNAKYTITHPYGEDVLTADGTGVVSVTEDIGLTAGEFTGALGSRIGPFLKWDTGAPAGYIGDPSIDHAITGSPYVDGAGNPQNYFKIDGPGIGGAGIDTVSTDKFSLLGKLATNNGVDNTSATYSRNADGTQSLDVYAKSAPDQALDVSGTGFNRTTMLGQGGRYFAHIDFTGAPPASVKVTNSGDKPAAVKTTPVVDAVNISSAVYDTATSSLTVKATSSDAATPPTLTVAGFGPMTGATTVFGNVTAPPATITVDSSAGGTDSDDVTGTGPGLAPISVQAFAGADATVQQGQNVTLDGSESTGEVTSYAWTQVSGTPVTLTGADTAKPTFTAPGTSGPLSFTLTVTGPGGPSSDTVDLTVADVVAPVAAAGPDQTVVRGAKVTLNGTASTGATTYQWTQVQETGDPAVTLTGSNTATPSFTFPAYDNPLTFQLTVAGPGGTSTDSVSVAPKADALTATARYRTGGREWIISGTATLLSPANTVTVHNGPTLSGPVIGSPAAVDAVDGTWKVRVKPSAVAPEATRTISIESKLGGVRLAIPVNVTS